MDSALDAAIRKSRKILNNPYAYLDGNGGYSAVWGHSHADVHAARRDLENPYAYLDEHGGYGEFMNQGQVRKSSLPILRPAALLGSKNKGDLFSKVEIEAIVRRLQLEIWANRRSIWPDREDITAVEVLDPVRALQFLGYRVDVSETLGQYSVGGEIFEIAGTVDDHVQHVQLSRRFSSEICNFTAAHELAHAILHQASGLHRDRAQDGGAGSAARDEREVEADIFAANFLMPEKPVRTAFRRAFLTDHFTITDETSFALIADSTDALEKKCRTSRDLAKFLASSEQYGGRHFHSLAHQFRVSTEAMAIRLEELCLVSR